MDDPLARAASEPLHESRSRQKIKPAPTTFFDILVEKDVRKRGQKIAAAAQASMNMEDALEEALSSPPSDVVLDPSAHVMADLPIFLQQLAGDVYLDKSSVRLSKRLGEGGFAVVHKAELKGPGGAGTVAIKALKPGIIEDDEDMKELIQEANLLRKMEHKYIVRFCGVGSYETDSVCAMRETVFFAEEFMGGGTLKHLILEQMKKKLPRKYRLVEALRWCTHIAEALSYLHHCDPVVVHRDLKPENVLLTKTNTKDAQAKIADFGLHKRLSKINKRLNLNHAFNDLSDMQGKEDVRSAEEGSSPQVPESHSASREKPKKNSALKLNSEGTHNNPGRLQNGRCVVGDIELTQLGLGGLQTECRLRDARQPQESAFALHSGGVDVIDEVSGRVDIPRQGLQRLPFKSSFLSTLHTTLSLESVPEEGAPPGSFTDMGNILPTFSWSEPGSISVVRSPPEGATLADQAEAVSDDDRDVAWPDDCSSDYIDRSDSSAIMGEGKVHGGFVGALISRGSSAEDLEALLTSPHACQSTSAERATRGPPGSANDERGPWWHQRASTSGRPPHGIAVHNDEADVAETNRLLGGGPKESAPGRAEWTVGSGRGCGHCLKLLNCSGCKVLPLSRPGEGAAAGVACRGCSDRLECSRGSRQSALQVLDCKLACVGLPEKGVSQVFPSLSTLSILPTPDDQCPGWPD
ncbi:unnamed protein product [Ostreobium quekettii]|uniref:Protein kinase domain-containing protein n=1 Tax=Ostreobium quekettii TaxID=121088 RepID=A0A8S1J5T4_9CHLO|nr:unnamed protein product [Ostreobium quekettii]